MEIPLLIGQKSHKKKSLKDTIGGVLSAISEKII